jgi:hypothetical protein
VARQIEALEVKVRVLTVLQKYGGRIGWYRGKSHKLSKRGSIPRRRKTILYSLSQSVKASALYAEDGGFDSHSEYYYIGLVSARTHNALKL